MIVPKDSDDFFKKFFARSPFSRAFLIIGEEDREGEAILQKLTAHLQGEREGSVLDFHRYEEDALAIEAAREIHEKAHQTSWTGNKIFLIKCGYISGEAQAVLLKTLEEPSANTYFIIAAKSESGFSPPLLSRLTVLKPAKQTLQAPSSKLQAVPISLKMELEEAARAAKERTSAEKFLDTLEIWAHNEIKGGEHDYELLARFAEDLLTTKAKFFERTYFTRMLLEHIVISRAYIIRS